VRHDRTADVTKPSAPDDPGASAWPYIFTWDECSGCRHKRKKGGKSDACPPRCKGYRPAFRGRKGTRCRAQTFGVKGTALVEFADGVAAVVSRRALRKVKE